MRRLAFLAFMWPSFAFGYGGALHTVQINDGAAHQYELNETTGTTATDNGSSPSNGTYNGGFTLNQTPISPDLTGNVKLDGSTGYINLNFADPSQAGDGSFSVEFLYQPTSLQTTCAAIVNDQPDTNHKGFRLDACNSSWRMTVAFTGGTVIVGSGPSILAFAVGYTQLVDMVYDGTGNTLKLYVDGRLQTTATTSGTYIAATSGNKSLIGKYPALSTNLAAGYFANVAFFPSALSAAKVFHHYGSISSGACNSTNQECVSKALQFPVLGPGTGTNASETVTKGLNYVTLNPGLGTNANETVTKDLLYVIIGPPSAHPFMHIVN